MNNLILHSFSYRKYWFKNYQDITKATKIYLNTTFPTRFEDALLEQKIWFKRES